MDFHGFMIFVYYSVSLGVEEIWVGRNFPR